MDFKSELENIINENKKCDSICIYVQTKFSHIGSVLIHYDCCIKHNRLMIKEDGMTRSEINIDYISKIEYKNNINILSESNEYNLYLEDNSIFTISFINKI